MKIWDMQKRLKKGKYTLNLIPRNKFSMGKPHSMQLEASSHHEPQMSRGKNTKPFFPPSIFSSTQSHLVPERITGSCMTMAKSLKPDLSYHLTFVRKVSRDLNVTHWEPSSHHVQCITHPISEKVLYKTSSTILTIELKYCEFLICPDDNFTF